MVLDKTDEESRVEHYHQTCGGRWSRPPGVLLPENRTLHQRNHRLIIPVARHEDTHLSCDLVLHKSSNANVFGRVEQRSCCLSCVAGFVADVEASATSFVAVEGLELAVWSWDRGRVEDELQLAD